MKNKVVFGQTQESRGCLTAVLSFEIEMSLEVTVPQTHREREELTHFIRLGYGFRGRIQNSSVQSQ